MTGETLTTTLGSARRRRDAVYPVRIGVSGWRYPEWRGVFYPQKMPQRNELSFVSQTFDSVELNGSFYSLQAPSSYKAWRKSAPAAFVFAVKGSRFITHMKALRDVDIALANFFASGPLALGPTLGPILWQLPARARFDADRLENFFRLLPKNTDEAAALAHRHDHRIKHGSVLRAEAFAEIRHAFEPRHESFGCIEARRLFQKYRVAFVVSDGAESLVAFVTSL